ncbi:MAG: bifunctional precorrin-2 dehydrogenase/sirohydrochlorin ferrochelatase, partial [Sinobacteraceae bacterium]|nr:bifunctional precorrin-2 dehydrogenase/sirohydrochlorin ferrochelatase [Nevskiaceae bacterium]
MNMQTNNTPADFPIFLRLAGQRVVIVGGGQVALRKLRRVLRSGAQAELVANRLHADVAALVAQGQARHVAEQFQPQQLDGCVFVFAATDNTTLNARVAEAAKQRGIFVNVVDNAQLSSAISPAIVDRTPVTIAVSSGGTAPVLARRLREDIERRLPAELGALARFIGRTRGYIKNRLPQPARRLLWERFLDSSGADAVLQGDRARGAATLAALAGDAVNRA